MSLHDWSKNVEPQLLVDHPYPTYLYVHRLPAKLSRWNGSARSMNTLPARLYARISVDLGTACFMTRAFGALFARIPVFSQPQFCNLGCSTRDVFVRVANQLVEHHDVTGRWFSHHQRLCWGLIDNCAPTCRRLKRAPRGFSKNHRLSVARAPKYSGTWPQLHRMLKRRRQLRRGEKVVSKARHVSRAPDRKIARMATVHVVLFYF